ncbi:MAG: biotin/lipoate A/B protein ligase family protein [Ktedonobacterales bacterium]
MSVGSLNGENWRLLSSSQEPMQRQLALSEALLATMNEGSLPVLRWYVSERPVLVLGNGQSLDAVDLSVCRAHEVEVLRRTSGGTAVLLDRHAVSMEVALPIGHPLAGGDIIHSYQWIGELWAQTLQVLGIAEARAIPTQEVRDLPALAKDDPVRLACYGTLSPYEPVVGLKKVIGLSQVRRRSAVLYQVGAHLQWRPEALVALLALSEDERRSLIPRLRASAAGIDEMAGRSIAAGELRDATHNLLAALLGVCLTRGGWTAAERAAAERIELERFQPVGHKAGPGHEAKSWEERTEH